ncbi:transketolase [Buchnera aphidicola str. Bp (Baizongia pistaciae)]|uniref:Transketolase n=1 Tax=Buchnera aphidicola subsp. Baizongia pistaciae (strain Bp) TaxID=224915 RepID=TKT_BUCBP|nr:transketolase [Buchnera aphidicola]Q89AY2.1 RecName: Full=Transketolase; Short=TK [Buchnera aphidicola str. Bp (Baizongia pistaciae)]AAO26823.1 transketolase [Buchnera aphidicola str. Bp (Baizongia pistaciae)]
MCLRRKLANAIRALSIDAVQEAQSGHPGMPMGMADIAEVLWREFFKHNPKNPLWNNRDRFILSNGHGSMLLYSILHLTGYKLSIDDLKKFRQLGSNTPGHPEIGSTPGVEMTTGPLGQGLGAAVGMAIAERTLASTFNKPNYDIVDHYTWVFVGDGCLMEGISHEVCSLAGTFGLGKLIVFYDSNGISIDGKVEEWFTDDTENRFKAYNWHVVSNVDGHDYRSISSAIKDAILVKNKPSLIICKTIIGYGSPNKSGLETSHGAPLGENEVLLTKQKLGWTYPPFVIPQDVYDHWNFNLQGVILENEWNKKFQGYYNKYPDLANEYLRRISKNVPDKFVDNFNKFIKELYLCPKNIATRVASQNVLEFLGKSLPELIGGSADLAPSNLTMWSKSKSIKQDISGNYVHYGVREFGMTAISNGIAHYGGFIPYVATFLAFMDYARSAVRMSALMKTQNIFIYSHDSIGLGEDGPTHQPIEQLSALRFIPNVNVWRPCDQLETAIAWKNAIERKDGPTALILSRQILCQIDRSQEQINDIYRGGYIVNTTVRSPKVIIVATGSEVKIALDVSNILFKKGILVRVVSMPSTNVFDQQDNDYKEFIFPRCLVHRVAIEAGISDFWYKYVGLTGCIIGIDTFGESGSSDQLFSKFGFNSDIISEKIISYLKSS